VAKNNVKGECALCKKIKTLCKSHYLSKALYKLSSVDGEPPVIMTPDEVALSPRQMWAHLLCRDCEKLFDERGEKYTLKWINRGKGRIIDFPLLDRIRLAMEVKRSKGSVTYSGKAMGINTESLAYFALSTLWRGAAYKWKTLKGQITFIELGKFAEPIRRYLLGETGIPDGVYVLVGVCTDVGSQVTVFPPANSVGQSYKMFSILVRGIWFHIIVDDNPPKGVEELCCVRSAKKVIHLENCHQRFNQAGGRFKKAKKIDKRLL
jgi:hypothetical protein